MEFLLSSQNVADYLLEIGLCNKQNLASIQVETEQPGKNFNLLVSLPSNCKLLVKQERYRPDGKTADEFFHEWQFHELLRQDPDLGELSAMVSQLVHFDGKNSIIIHNYLTNYIDLQAFYHKNNTFVTTIPSLIGENLALLHRTSFERLKCQEFFSNNSPKKSQAKLHNPVQKMERIEPEVFSVIPADCLKFFTLYQRYESLGVAVADIAARWHPCCVTHNDLKLNNILIHQDWEQSIFIKKQLPQSIIKIIDWERCAWGDPALDLGTIIASYLQIWLFSLFVGSSIEIEESLRLAVTPLEAIQPSIVALTKDYITNFPLILERRPDFLQRVVQFTGLDLIHQIYSLIQYSKYFGNIGICMLQVAKSLLCRPKQSILSVFGMTESELTCLNGSPISPLP